MWWRPQSSVPRLQPCVPRPLPRVSRRFFGLTAPPAERGPDRSAQKTLTSFFGKGPAGGGSGGGGECGPASASSSSTPPTPSKVPASPLSSTPPTPGGDAAVAAAPVAAAEVRFREELVGRLEARRREIAAANQHAESGLLFRPSKRSSPAPCDGAAGNSAAPRTQEERPNC